MFSDTFDAWQYFARTNNLTFFPEQPPDHEAYVVGLYKDYHLKLSYWSFGLEIILTDNNHAHTPAKSVTPTDIEAILTDCANFSKTKGYIRVEERGRKVFYHQTHRNQAAKIEHLRRTFDLLCDIADMYQGVLLWGNEAIPVLQNVVAQQKKISPLTRQLLQDLMQDSMAQMVSGNVDALCLQCYNRCKVYEINLHARSDMMALRYYGCRYCYQNQDLIEGIKDLTVILNNQVTERTQSEGATLKINWFQYQNSFDFDRIEIVQATDRDVERFAVQVGNDTDPYRQPRYRQMTCTIDPACQLSENTLRILRRTFGTVMNSPSS